MNNVVSVYRIDHSNLGDLMSAPRNYFQWLDGPRIDIFDDPTRHEKVLATASLVVVGGGGLLGHCDSNIETLLDVCAGARRPPRMVFWGAGNGTRDSLPPYLSRFDLVGIRDYPLARANSVNWVPCCSALHPAFDAVADSPPTAPIHIYDAHRKPVRSLLPALPPYPTTTNDARSVTMAHAVAHLANAHTVITRSYHGAYWASLLGADVQIAADALPKKYLGLRYEPTLVGHVPNDRAPRSPSIPLACRKQRILETRSVLYSFSNQVRALLDRQRATA